MLSNAAPWRPLSGLHRLQRPGTAVRSVTFESKGFLNNDSFCRWWTHCLSSPTQPSCSKLESGLLQVNRDAFKTWKHDTLASCSLFQGRFPRRRVWRMRTSTTTWRTSSSTSTQLKRFLTLFGALILSYSTVK